MNCDVLLKKFYPEAQYGGFSEVDGTVRFYSRLHSIAPEQGTILSVGCGRPQPSQDNDLVRLRKHLRRLTGDGRHVIGIDIDPDGANRKDIHEFRLIHNDGRKWPIEDESIDLAYSNFVLEHVEKPVWFFAEAHRVLKPGGIFAIRTPNKWNYVSVIARLVPDRKHGNLVRSIQGDRSAYPTHYRCNTRRTIRAAYHRANFVNIVVYSATAEPSYLCFSQLAYRLGRIYQRFAPDAVQATWIGFGSKEGGAR